ncbi:hypothetical protein [Mesorhizobium sp. M00.F.Ca.ET.217.01.1.1]|uniref:hypothetical protein n=1 Tax=Mesorhizobium sp. M00.F.Ca.ET.217.01.1.1 TaxID=2500529 RepID=UPI000FD85997|nr:hypothetical protein [Mesorhizobium sp. M00.F.Ca.ET.217.01.1.1]TGQ19278.1 hypothetical protein EN860_019285 [Mesorhizobium sp. M00.F.Ca.ET.217.01.1.1]
MSSDHIIIVARNARTGEIRLPLEDTTLYGLGGEDELLRSYRGQFSEEWALSLYKPFGLTYAGSKP